jgi:hypothetical protein
MRPIFAALRRASKNHLVLRRFRIFLRQAFDEYQVFPLDGRGARDRLATVLRQSTAPQQPGLHTAYASMLPAIALSMTVDIDLHGDR